MAEPLQYISGLASSIDWSNVINQLMEVYRSQRVQPLEERRDQFQEKLSLWQELSSKLSALEDAVEALAEGEVFSVFRVSLTSFGTEDPEGILQVTPSPSAQEGVYYLEVVQIAQAHQMASKSFSAATDPLGLAGTITINGTEITIETTDSLYDIRSKINSSVDGVSASVLMVAEGDYRLTLSSEDTGLANQITVDDPGALFDFTTTVAAQDAIINVNSIQVQRSSNTIGDLIEGLTIDLKRAAPGTTITLRVSRDMEGITEGIRDFVDAYNEVASFIRQQFTYSEGENSVLMGDLSLRGIQSNLQSRLLQTLSDFPDGWNALTFYGVSLDRNGTLGLDSAEFQAKFVEDPDTTIQFFQAVASSFKDYLESITDPYTGLIKLKTDTLQRQIEDINDQIEHQERLLEKEQERFMRQFVALEEALAQLQSLSSWLSQQIQASFNNA